MNAQQSKAAMARAFRETTLGLIGLFQIYEVDQNLIEATAEVLGDVFQRHLQGAPPAAGPGPNTPLHALADKLDRVAERASLTA